MSVTKVAVTAPKLAEVWLLNWRGMHVGTFRDAQAAVRSSMRLCAKEGLRWPMRGVA